MHTWSTDDAGRTLVDGVPIELSPRDAAVFSERVMRWLSLVERWATPARVPLAWVLGMIWAESTGRPEVVSADNGVGLMGITSKGARGPYTTEQLKDASNNIERGVVTIASYARTARARDLPAVASRYNAGGLADGAPHPAPGMPWGFRETPGHIERVVRAANTAVRLLALRAGDTGNGAAMLGLLLAYWAFS